MVWVPSVFPALRHESNFNRFLNVNRWDHSLAKYPTKMKTNMIQTFFFMVPIPSRIIFP